MVEETESNLEECGTACGEKRIQNIVHLAPKKGQEFNLDIRGSFIL